MKEDYPEGVCTNCSATGLVGDTCPVCGGIYEDLTVGAKEDDLEVPEEPETYPLEVLDEEEKPGDDIVK